MKIFLLYMIVSLHCFLQTTSIRISPCAKWDAKGTTLIGPGIAGNSFKELNEPISISIHEPTNVLYMADHGNGRIQMFALNDSFATGVTVATNLFLPLHIYVDDENNEPTIYVSLSVQNRIEKWTKGASAGLQIGGECQRCVGVAVDSDKNVYISDTTRQRIIKWSPQNNETITVAGKTDQSGSTAEFLDSPEGVYVTRNGEEIYAVDTGNSRIQKWVKNAQQGVTVAGSSTGVASNDSASLRNPISVLVDEVTNIMYIADTFNHQIKRWSLGAITSEIIVGVGGQGNSSDQLNTPTDLTFDNDGNIYVADFKNNRVQVFRLIDNTLCSSSSAKSASYKIISSLMVLWIIVKLI